MERDRRYRIFVRAVVDTPQKHLYTSSPFSEYLSLSMREVPPGDPPRRPDPNAPGGDPDVSVNRNTEEAGLVWIVGKYFIINNINICTNIQIIIYLNLELTVYV